MKLDNPLVVQWEYASEERLAKRNKTYSELTEGVNPENVIVEAVRESSPRRFLDVGCGMGELAERVQRELGADVVAVDISPRMVELTRARGVDAQVADVQALPFEDGSFDCVAANWVLYHVPDLDLGVRELARVLRPGGRLVAATLGAANMQELWDLLGGEVTGRALLRLRERRGGARASLHGDRAARGERDGRVPRPGVDAGVRGGDHDALSPRRPHPRAGRARSRRPRRTASSWRSSRDDPSGGADRAEAQRRGARRPRRSPS